MTYIPYWRCTCPVAMIRIKTRARTRRLTYEAHKSQEGRQGWCSRRHTMELTGNCTDTHTHSGRGVVRGLFSAPGEEEKPYKTEEYARQHEPLPRVLRKCCLRLVLSIPNRSHSRCPVIGLPRQPNHDQKSHKVHPYSTHPFSDLGNPMEGAVHQSRLERHLP